MEQIDTFLGEVDRILDTELQSKNLPSSQLNESCAYSTFAGGKRIRPLILLLTTSILGGDLDSACYFAAALEMVHTYSLIHDDLPAMDNDDIRRGKPSNHKKYDEATAILAGDALLTHAFSVLTKANLPSDNIVCAVKVLSELAGLHGMVAGQEIDMLQTKENTNEDSLLLMYELKTSNLLRCAVSLGCIASGILSGNKYENFNLFAKNIGLAYQIQDDLLDFYGSETFGRPKGSDEKNGKITYLFFHSKEEAEEKVKGLTEEAVNAIKEYDTNHLLSDVAISLIGRKK